MRVSELIEELEDQMEMMGDLEVKGLYVCGTSGSRFTIQDVLIDYEDTPDGRVEYILLSSE